ncbi:hypothetical protein DIPPA_01319 [Diplonema papillatum]|nr:hypothetical protein DIPPA_01319 [Diplonema papillatum]
MGQREAVAHLSARIRVSASAKTQTESLRLASRTPPRRAAAVARRHAVLGGAHVASRVASVAFAAGRPARWHPPRRCRAARLRPLQSLLPAA